MAELNTQSKVMDKPKIKELLKSKQDGVLSLTDGQSTYGLPIAYAFYQNDTIYFGMSPSGRKYEYFKKCKNVSFTLHKTFGGSDDPLKMGWWSIVLDGVLSQVTDPEEVRAVIELMDKQGLFPPGLKEQLLGVILQNPDQSYFFKMNITEYGGKELEEAKS